MRCATLSPLDLDHVRLAVATVRAGGVALVDAVHPRPDRAGRITTNVRHLLDTPSLDRGASIGLRVHASRIAESAALLDAFVARPHWLVLCGWAPDAVAPLVDRLRSDTREIWLEIGSGADVRGVSDALSFAGWAACGAECGGLAGRESTFMLAQHLARQRRPFLLRGGIGLHAAAACRVSGAAAVVLDDVLLLLRESPLPPRWRHTLGRLGMADTSAIGERLGQRIRTVDRPDVPAARELRARHDALTAGAVGARRWAGLIDDLVGWDEPERRAWPVGEAAGQAASVAARYGTVGRLVHEVLASSERALHVAASAPTLSADAPLARSHGTRYPIVQGPMTRVSDTVAFASAVSDGGALPLFALALMRQASVHDLLTAARERLGARPWGVGILGFVPPDLRREQLEVVDRIRPAFALVAGGRPDQAADLESRGIATYIHTPAPLLKPFLDQGTRRFVFEGAECGGHIGPLHSFTLWDYAVDVLLQHGAAAAAGELHVLFAGGIHDALSAAMVSAMAAPLAARGSRVGVLMGTAYLFTGEAVQAGAITPAFQRLAVASDDTTTIETAPGHVIRCAASAFVDTFDERRDRLHREGLSGAELTDALDRLIVGRSRIASKGVERRGDELIAIDESRQAADGLYMLGDVAALHDRTTTIAGLHHAVSEQGARLLQSAASRETASGPARVEVGARPCDVAIVGASCLVPGARDVDTFWRHQLDQVGAIGEIPSRRWDWRLYYDADQAARDRIYSRWGGFVDAIPFDPLRFGIPPKSLPAITIPQLLALELTRRALVDAGFGDAIADDELRMRTAVVFGIGNTADVEQFYQTRAALPLLLPSIGEDVLNRLPEWTEESYPGLLASVVAGRVANRFDFRGPNLTVDAACASSLATLDVAVRELADGRSDVVIAGGLEFEMSPQAYMGFTSTRALSPRGLAEVFDRGADGIVISEGGVVFVLKRLADAERAGDRIYAVIKGVGGASDGRGLSLTAPKPGGQRLALERAYASAGIDPASIRLYEAHGTGTALGDSAEIETIGTLLGSCNAPPGACVVGSLKSLLGHTRTAAGMLALLKTALALHHRVLPPHAGVRDPLPGLIASDTPLGLLREPRPWLREGHEPRRAGVSAFGFGGTNFHVVVEEHRAADEAAPGAHDWPRELFVFAAPDRAGLVGILDRVHRAAVRLDEQPRDGSTSPALTLRDLAYVCATEAPAGAPFRLAFDASTPSELRQRVADARSSVESGVEMPSGHVASGPSSGGLAFVFPGQGSQFPGMGSELALYFREVRETFELADHVVEELPARLSGFVFPAASFHERVTAAQSAALADTRVAQPAIGALSLGMLALASRLGLEPHAVAGHSYGELVALHAAGVFDREALLALSAARGRAMAGAGAEPGTMVMVAASAEQVARHLSDDSIVRIANRNGPDQVVLSGPTTETRAVADALRRAGFAVLPLRVSAAFHSALMKPARPMLSSALDRLEVSEPRLPVHANFDGQPYPHAPEAIRARLLAHLEQPVDFVAQIESMYAAGIRTFLELGPGKVLAGLITRILGDRPHAVLSADGGLRGWLDVVARLFVGGVSINVAALFDGRAVSWIDLARLPSAAAAPGWLIDGGHVWPVGASSAHVGVSPLLNRESAAAAPRQVVDSVEARPLLAVYREYEETMRHFLDQQERMLERVLQQASDAAGARPSPPASRQADPPAPPPAAVVTVAAPPTALDREALLARIVDVVSDRTGYTPDALGVDLDLEADLGIDSIKRMEVLGTVLEALPANLGRRLQGDLDRLTRQRTLRAIAEQLARASAAASPAAAQAGESRPETVGTIPRFTMRPHVIPLRRALAVRVAGLHLVTEDARGVGPLVVETLRARGADAQLIADEDLADVDRLAREVRRLRDAHGPVTGVLHLGPVGRSAFGDTVDAWRHEAAMTTKRFFHLLKLVAADVDQAGADATVIAVTAMGGDWGRNGCVPGTEMAGGCHGLLRSFEREYPGLHALVIDVDADRRPEELAAIVVDEYLARSSDREVGYPGADRVVYLPHRTTASDQSATDWWRPAPGWVVLATGGARGVTAEVCRDFAAPGVTMVVVGRSADGGSPDASRDAERRLSLQALSDAGATIEYHAVDVRDEPAFGGLIDDIYRRFGRLDAVVHGAGLIDDQRVEFKPADSFDRVFDTKVDSALILGRHLRADGLKWVILFSSVSGRFGNPGQGDYAAANEVLNRLAWTFRRRWPETRVVSFNWGPWRGTGMMSDAVLKLATARGLEPISTAAGRRFVVDELRHGPRRDAEVIAGEGPWARLAAGLADPEAPTHSGEASSVNSAPSRLE